MNPTPMVLAGRKKKAAAASTTVVVAGWTAPGIATTSVLPSWLHAGVVVVRPRVCEPGPLVAVDVALLLWWAVRPGATVPLNSGEPWWPRKWYVLGPGALLKHALAANRHVGVGLTTVIDGGLPRDVVLDAMSAQLGITTEIYAGARGSGSGSDPGGGSVSGSGRDPNRSAGVQGSESRGTVIRDAGLMIWKPDVVGTVRHHFSNLAAVHTVHDHPYPVLGRADRASRRRPHAFFAPGAATSRDFLDAVIKGIMDASADGTSSGSHWGPVEAYRTSLGRYLRERLCASSPSVAAELLEASPLPALTAIMLGANWSFFNHRAWGSSGGRVGPNWFRRKMRRPQLGPRDPRIPAHLPPQWSRDSDAFDAVITAADLRAHAMGKRSLAVCGAEATTWVMIDLDHGHVLAENPERRLDVLNRYRRDLHGIVAAFPGAIIEARMVRRDPLDPGVYAVTSTSIPVFTGDGRVSSQKSVPTMATPVVYRYSGNRVVHLSPDDPGTEVRGVHVWIRWEGWYPRDGITAAVRKTLDALEVRHGDSSAVPAVGPDIEIYPMEKQGAALPLRCSPVAVSAIPRRNPTRTTPTCVAVMDYVVVDADLIPVVGVLREGIDPCDAAPAWKPKDFIAAQEYRKRMWDVFHDHWRAEEVPPGAVAPVGYEGITVALGPEIKVGGFGVPVEREVQDPFQVGVTTSQKTYWTTALIDPQILRAVRIRADITVDPEPWADHGARARSRAHAEVTPKGIVTPEVLEIWRCWGTDATQLVPEVILAWRRVSQVVMINTCVHACYVATVVGPRFRTDPGSRAPAGPGRQEGGTATTPQGIRDAPRPGKGALGDAVDVGAADLGAVEAGGPDSTEDEDVDNESGDDSGDDSGGGDADLGAVRGCNRTAEACRYDINHPRVLSDKEILGLAAGSEALAAAEIVPGRRRDALLEIVQVLQFNGATYLDACAVLDIIAERDPTGSSGIREDLWHRLRELWVNSQRRVMTGQYVPKSRKRSGDGGTTNSGGAPVELAAATEAWITAVITSASEDHRYRSSLRKEKSRTTWWAVVAAVVSAAQGRQEDWTSWALTRKFLRGEVASSSIPARYAKPRFTDNVGITAFLKWFQSGAGAVAVTTPGGPQQKRGARTPPRRFDITAVMTAALGAGVQGTRGGRRSADPENTAAPLP